MLHKDAHNRAVRRAMLEAQADAQLAELRSVPKRSRATERYAFKRLEREVMDIYAALDAVDRGLRYEEFGAAMVEVGFLRYVDADATFGASSTSAAQVVAAQVVAAAEQEGGIGAAVTPATPAAFAQSAGRPTKRLGGGAPRDTASVASGMTTQTMAIANARQEMLMLQRVWAKLVGFETADGVLHADTLLRFLSRALMSIAPPPPPPPVHGGSQPYSTPSLWAQRGPWALRNVWEEPQHKATPHEGSAATAKPGVDGSADGGGAPAAERSGEAAGGSSDAAEGSAWSGLHLREGGTDLRGVDLRPEEEGYGEDLDTLCEDFAALYRATLAYKPIGNVRHDFDGIPDDDDVDECTFAPTIDHKSRRLEEKRRAARAAALAAAAAAADAPAADFASASAAFASAAAAASSAGGGRLPSGGGKRHEALYEHAKKVEGRIEQQRKKKAEAELDGYTFTPKVNASSSTACVDGSSTNAAAKPMGEQRFAHLHARAKPKEAQLTTDEREALACTFKPKTNKYAPSQTHAPPPGYLQAVERMRRVLEDKELREAEEAEAARKRAAVLSRPAKPFSFQTEERPYERRVPLMYMDVNIGPGRTGRIGLHEGDDPAELASNFARTYQLDGAMEAKLAGLIEQYMKEVVPDLAQAAGAQADEADELVQADEAAQAAQAADAADAAQVAGHESF